MKSGIISIPTASTSDGTTYYYISVKLPLRTYTVRRRYSEFQDLLYHLCDELGISQADFPYQLPRKTLFFKNNTSTIETRRVQLEEFLNLIVTDSTMQNCSETLEFLQLPAHFKFSAGIFRYAGQGDLDLNVDESLINKDNWLELLRMLRSKVESLTTECANKPTVNNKIMVHETIRKLLRPVYQKLLNSLNSLKSGISRGELSRREVLLREVENDLNSLDSIISSGKKNSESESKEKFGRRILGAAPRETNDTLPLNNKELLQNQIQIQKNQDNELLELRKIIARQREIGEIIHDEVEQQNDMLEALHDHVDASADKLSEARRKAKKIL
ncbi:uncharacterized protein PRCAT00003193001 [Priceomyces carsonii]|uniref:uncharacterized protein n=1 Tax=Priceomyces carsonii TaxID=28549 RepID=UPI002ED7C2B6|nr:unnamed protein product [Priceomyces carsonii]